MEISFYIDFEIRVSNPKTTPGFDDSNLRNIISDFENLPKRRKIVSFTEPKVKEAVEAADRVTTLVTNFNNLKKRSLDALDIIKARADKANIKVKVDVKDVVLVNALRVIFGQVPEYITFDMYLQVMNYSFDLAEGLGELQSERQLRF